jgi:hypothetical protein
VPFPRLQGQASHRSDCRMASCPLLLGPQASRVAPQAADQGHGGTRIAMPPKHIRCQKRRPRSLMPGAAAQWAASPACFAELREKPSHGWSANLTRHASPSRHGLFDQRPRGRPSGPTSGSPNGRTAARDRPQCRSPHRSRPVVGWTSCGHSRGGHQDDDEDERRRAVHRLPPIEGGPCASQLLA